MYNLVISPKARQDYNNIYDWYDKQRPGLGSEFFDALKLGFDKLRVHPENYMGISQHRRRLKLDRFPYILIFRINLAEVRILSIKHTSRVRK